MSDSKFMKTYEYMGMPFPMYLLKVFIPIFIILLFGYFIFMFAFGPYMSDFFMLLVSAVLFLVGIIVLLFPYVLYIRKGKLIDADMHLFVTRMGILSLTYISRKDLFNILSEIKEYRELAAEIKKVYTLISKWNVDLPEACRIVAEKTPSEQLADFLTRMAHAVESGESAEIFSQDEQKAAMEEFAIKYENSVESIGILNEIYLASISSALFFITVAAILPMLMGGDYTSFYISIILFVVIEIGMLYYIYVSVPWEHIWESSSINTEIKVKLRRKLIFGILLCIPVGAVVVLLPIPFEIKVALSITPLIIPGYYATKMENTIKKREMLYPAFIRSLGMSASGTGKETTFALKKLRFYKFGPLGTNINNLYKRLALRIDKRLSWKIFGSETGSDLISKFNDLYVDGTEVGSDPKSMSQIISENFLKIVSLRKKRFLAASTTSGLLYGSMVFVTLPLYVLVWVVTLIGNMFTEISPVSQEFSDLSFFYGNNFSVDILRYLMFSVVIVHIAVSTVIKKVLSATNNIKILYDVVILTWIGAITAVLTYIFIGSILL